MSSRGVAPPCDAATLQNPKHPPSIFTYGPILRWGLRPLVRASIPMAGRPRVFHYALIMLWLGGSAPRWSIERSSRRRGAEPPRRRGAEPPRRRGAEPPPYFLFIM